MSPGHMFEPCESDDPECTCGACERDRAGAEGRALASEAHVRGGIAPHMRALLGELGIDEGGQGMEISQLAQHALGDIFGQFEKLGAATRDKCHGRTYAATSVPPVSRAEIKAALDYAGELVEYGRSQLGYLDGQHFAFNELVAFTANDELKHGVYSGLTANGHARVQVANENGKVLSPPITVEVNEGELRRVRV